MKVKEVEIIVNKKGHVGCTKNERYINLPDIRTSKRMYVQIVAFNDERPLALYWLNDKCEGDFADYRKVSKKVKEKVEEHLKSQ